MKRIMKTGVLMLAVAVMLTLGACSASSSKSYTFNVETGDTIKVKLDTSNGMSLSQKDGQFTVKKDEENILQGMFIHETGYNSYLAIKGQQGMRVLEDTEKDGNTYYMYEIEGESGTEENFVVWIRDSKTGMLIASLAGQEKAKEAFESLTITKE